ncbi:hypothetical protein GCM10009777_00270 [Microbacterium pumilum]|uniref:Ig-like domain-containing protein n=1 Tax=Microbacterium pumilum TaxID=344165 RepID=A0ABP5D162_9MICO
MDSSGTAPTATVTATVTVTATATPEPTSVPQSAGDPLSSFDAWLLCYGATFGVIGVPNDDTWTVQPYDETAALGGPMVTDNGDGTFTVLLTLLPKSGTGSGLEAICDASGTIGDPSVFVKFGRDIG